MSSHSAFILSEASRQCLLCADAPCCAACTHADPARALRALRFDNAPHAARLLRGVPDEELAAAERACLHPVHPIPLREVARALDELHPASPLDERHPSLAIDFCGIPCANPFFLASSAVATGYDMVARAFDMGWAGVFYKTICLHDMHEVSPRFDAVPSGIPGDFSGFRNMEQLSENPPEVDFDILRRLKADYPSKVIVASIMGQTESEWIALTRMAQDARVDALELNFSCPQMTASGMGSDVGQSPELVAAFTAAVCRSTTLPVIPKMTPNVSHLAPVALAAVRAGADALSAINTVKSVTLSEESAVSDRMTVSGLSGRAVKPIALRHILDMAQSLPEGFPLSGIGGVETWRDAVDFLRLGCCNIQVCTSVMQYGYRIIEDLLSGLERYLAQRRLSRLSDLVGEDVPRFVSPDALDRTTMVFPQITHGRCLGCGRCFVACRDGGHQAISFDRAARCPYVDGHRCVGCLLCRLVCPAGAIAPTRRFPKPSARS